jgi:hypothetical protein
MKEDDAVVKDLVKSTGCDSRLAVMLIDFTGGDVEGAKRIIRAVPKDIFALKMKFITQVTGYYGALFFCYDEKELSLKRVACVVTDEKDIGTIDLSQRWLDFEASLYDYMREKRVDGGKIERLKGRFLEKDVVTRLSGLLKVGRPLKDEELRNLLVDELYNIFSDTNIAVKVALDMTDVFELNKRQEIRVAEDEETLKHEEAEEEIENQRMRKKPDQSLIVLRVDPVLSPVKGTEIKELEFGDNIQVRITDERDIADYLAVLLGGKVDSIRVPIYAKIVEVKELEGGNVGVLTQFGPGIMGMFKVPSEVKVVSSQEEEESQPLQKGKRKELNPLWVVGGIVVIMGIFILLISMSR